MRKSFYGWRSRAVLLTVLCASTNLTFAATPIDLKHQPASILEKFATLNKNNLSSFKEISKSVDFNQTQHTRLQQVYAGVPVWGGDIVTHTPQGKNLSSTSMNGIIYEGLEADLHNKPNYIASNTQKNLAQQQAVFSYQKKLGVTQTITQTNIKDIIYVDNEHRAHWAFLISFLANNTHKTPERPTFIMDATTLVIYKQWNDIKTLSQTLGGGLGGNEKVGKINYDGLNNDFPSLKIMRDDKKSICYLKNADVTVKNAEGEKVIEFKCKSKDKNHNNVYWDADHDAINGAYSPSNDALYVGMIVKDMYQSWYKIPVLKEGNKPMMLTMIVHMDIENAFWDGTQMTFGDGADRFYPLVSLGVGAHEISHGFTSQHSDLAYLEQSGGLNESFSDMAAQAALYYSTETNNWQIGDDIVKEKNKALRYMDEPTKDCNGRHSGEECSISNAKDYNSNLDVHYSSGVFNKLFYLLGTSKGWNTQKAFNVMVQANQHYWTSNTEFTDAACGVMKAAKDYKYPTQDVAAAADKVGIDVTRC